MTRSTDISISERKLARSGVVEEEVIERRRRLVSTLQRGLPTLPSYLLDLNALLAGPIVDLKKAAKVIRTDPSLSAQVLRLCNSALFGLRHRVLSIEQAAVLLGAERLRTMVLTCAVMQFARQRVPVESLLEFWQHSFLAALLSERSARLLEYAEPEQAYLGGLLHDIGLLPLWMLVIDEQMHHRELPPDNWPDDLEIERAYFGMDHGKVGRSLAVCWNFMPSFMDVFEHHHEPARAQHDPYLVGIVSAVDQFLKSCPLTASEVGGTTDSGAEPAGTLCREQGSGTPGYLIECFPSLTQESCLQIQETLRSEYTHVLPLVRLGISVVAPGVAGDQIPCEEKPT